MLKLLKYDMKECYKPFGLLVIFHLLLALMSALGLYTKTANDILESFYQLEEILLIIYGCRKLYIDFCSDRNILALLVPADIIKRFISKLLILNILYIAFQASRLLFGMVNTYSVYNVLKAVGVIKYRPYIIYDIVGGILFYSSALSIVTFGMIAANSLVKKKFIVPVLNVVVIFGLFWASVVFGQSYVQTLPHSDESIILTAKVMETTGKVEVEYRADYGPFTYSKVGTSAGWKSGWSSSTVDIGFYSWSGVEYSAVCIVIFLAGSMVLLKWKGINY